jgi:hypothetical protein
VSVPDTALFAGKCTLCRKGLFKTEKAALCRKGHFVPEFTRGHHASMPQVSPKYPPSIYQVSPKEVGRSTTGYSGKARWQGADGKQEDSGIAPGSREQENFRFKKIW